MSFLGKRISVPIEQRDNFGKRNGKYIRIAGICQLEPMENKILGVPLQTVVDRMPVELKDINQIKLV